MGNISIWLEVLDLLLLAAPLLCSLCFHACMMVTPFMIHLLAVTIATPQNLLLKPQS